MNKDALLKSIAETGYNVGFGAKKHFATYDIVEKVPGWIGFVSMAFGIYALVFEVLNEKWLAATLIIFGIAGLYIYFYDTEKMKYEDAGRKLTQLFNKLRDLYRSVETANDQELPALLKKLSDIESEYYGIGISKQILFSGWYAHFKFFWEHQIDWIDEQKNFRFWRDKIPLSAILVLVTIVFGLLGLAANMIIPCFVSTT
ncbi:SLATT domain-containing protein [Parasphingorhabdus sp.]|uniref:SLATT domain-containing protein n=1 Tax=Parasphingorhabdus sp. TaxID=2709688 RepID=UPI003BAFD9B0